MHLSPHEQERRLLPCAVELARRRRARGLKLNLPEATAIVSDHVLEGARDGVPELLRVAGAAAALDGRPRVSA